LSKYCMLFDIDLVMPISYSIKCVMPLYCAISIPPWYAPHRFLQMNYSFIESLWLVVAVVKIYGPRLLQNTRTGHFLRLYPKLDRQMLCHPPWNVIAE
jgi:hypothetical protein